MTPIEPLHILVSLGVGIIGYFLRGILSNFQKVSSSLNLLEKKFAVIEKLVEILLDRQSKLEDSHNKKD
jgi:uncharacterized protein YoxC